MIITLAILACIGLGILSAFVLLPGEVIDRD